MGSAEGVAEGVIVAAGITLDGFGVIIKLGTKLGWSERAVSITGYAEGLVVGTFVTRIGAALLLGFLVMDTTVGAKLG